MRPVIWVRLAESEIRRLEELTNIGGTDEARVELEALSNVLSRVVRRCPKLFMSSLGSCGKGTSIAATPTNLSWSNAVHNARERERETTCHPAETILITIWNFENKHQSSWYVIRRRFSLGAAQLPWKHRWTQNRYQQWWKNENEYHRCITSYWNLSAWESLGPCILQWTIGLRPKKLYARTKRELSEGVE